jgi:hypothetical protein
MRHFKLNLQIFMRYNLRQATVLEDQFLRNMLKFNLNSTKFVGYSWLIVTKMKISRKVTYIPYQM